MIRFAEQSDFPAIRSLWETCFPDEGGFNDYFFSHLYEPQHMLLLTQENTLCAMLQMLPYTLSINGNPHEITYIYGVCTHPAHRRHGYAAELLEHSFVLDKERGRPVYFDTLLFKIDILNPHVCHLTHTASGRQKQFQEYIVPDICSTGNP